MSQPRTRALVGAGVAVPARPGGQVLVPAQHAAPSRSQRTVAHARTAGTVRECSPRSPPPAAASSWRSWRCSCWPPRRPRRAVLVSRSAVRARGRAGRRRTGPGRCCWCPATAGGPESLQSLADGLTAAGRDATVVGLPGDGTGDLRASADALGEAVDAALARTGADERRRRRLLGRRTRRAAVGGRRARRRRPPGAHPRLAAPRHVARRPRRRRRARPVPAGLPADGQRQRPAGRPQRAGTRPPTGRPGSRSGRRRTRPSPRRTPPGWTAR